MHCHEFAISLHYPVTFYAEDSSLSEGSIATMRMQFIFNHKFLEVTYLIDLGRIKG